MKSWILLSLKFLVSAGMISYLLTKLDWSLISTLETDYIAYLLAATIISVVFLAFMAVRWRLLLDRSSHQKAPFLLLYQWYLVGMFFSIFLPGAIGGDVMRAKYAAQNFQLALKKILLQITAERLFGLAGLTIFFLIGFSNVVIDESFISAELAILALAVGLGLFALAKYMVSRDIKVDYKSALLLLILSMAAQFADILILFILQTYFGLSLSIWVFMLIMPIVFVATVLPVSLGGLGVREGVMVAMLGLFSVDTSVAILLALSLYLAKVLNGLIGAVVFIYLPAIETRSN
jgi:uncharacterized membrane protein YbhN (UPF0104 family)